jgi:hypothetical protein
MEIIAAVLSEQGTQVAVKLFDGRRQMNQPPAVNNNLQAIESSQQHRTPADRLSWRCRSVKSSETCVLMRELRGDPVFGRHDAGVRHVRHVHRPRIIWLQRQDLATHQIIGIALPVITHQQQLVRILFEFANDLKIADVYHAAPFRRVVFKRAKTDRYE